MVEMVEGWEDRFRFLGFCCFFFLLFNERVQGLYKCGGYFVSLARYAHDCERHELKVVVYMHKIVEIARHAVKEHGLWG